MRYLVKAHVKVGEVMIDNCIFNAIGRLDPNKHLEVIVTQSMCELLSESPCIDKLHTRPKDLWSDIKLQASLLNQSWDVVLSTRTATRMNLFHFFANGKVKRSRKQIKAKPERPEIVNRLSLLDGILNDWDKDIDATIHFDNKRTDNVSTKFGLDIGKKYLTLGPGASEKMKMWDKDKFVNLAKQIKANFDHVLVLGSEAENDLCQYVAEKSGATNLAGKLKLLDTCALLSFANLHVGNDSGLGHLAAGVGTNCLAVGNYYDSFNYKPWEQHMLFGDPLKINVSEVISYLKEHDLI